MVFLVFSSDFLENTQAVGKIRSVNRDFLEPSVKRSVLFDNLPEFFRSGGSYALDFTSCERRFQHIGRIQAPACSSRTYNGVEFVDEKDDVRIVGYVLYYALEAFLKVSSVFRPGHYGSDVQRDNPLPEHLSWYRTFGYPQGNSLDNRRFSHTRFPDQHRVVLLSPAEDLNDPFHLLLPSHNRVQPPFNGRSCQIISEILD